MLRFAKSLPYLPDLAVPRPLISEQDKARAAAEPPLPVPFHCKPWVDGQTIGWTLFYGYRTAVKLRRAAGGGVVIENGEALDAESGRRDTLILTEHGLRLETGYALCSPAGLITLIIPANRPVGGLVWEMACLETEEQYQPVSLVFRIETATEIVLAAGVELARAVLIPRPELLPAAGPLDGDELAALRRGEGAYRS
jgi:hypothetical protein